MKSSLYHSKTKAIILGGLMAGTLDILAAVIILAGGNVIGTLKFIAKGAIGLKAYAGGLEMALLGLLIHYVIAFIFTLIYFQLLPSLPFLKKYKLLGGLVYGLLIWTVMNYIVLPFTYNPPGPFVLSVAWKAIVILIIAVGMPISFIAAKHYPKK